MQTVATTQFIPWSIVEDEIRWTTAWTQALADAQVRLLDLATGRIAAETIALEVEPVWWLAGDLGGLFPEPVVRLELGPVIGPLVKPSGLFARFELEVE